MSRNWNLIIFGLLGLAVTAATVSLFTKREQTSARVNTTAGTSWTASPPHRVSKPAGASQPAVAVDPRVERRKAKDYKQLMDLLLPLAQSGSAAAQYELASALHYCDLSVHAHFISRSTGAVKTPEEIQQFVAKLDEGSRELVSASYQRCHGFLKDLSSLSTASYWLDRAATAGYAAAIFLQADFSLQSSVIKGDAAAIDRARQSAIVASTSADPDVLFGMANFVDGVGKTSDRAGRLMSAWWLVGCERGYDCSAQSDWIQFNCVDPQCANKPTVVEELQRMNGAAFGQVQQLAEQINAAIDSRNVETIKKYL